MKDDLKVVREGSVKRIGVRQGGVCPEGFCERTLRLDKELTRWKREEAVLRDIERRYLALLDSPLLILLILSEGRVLFMNRRGEEFFGFSLRERPRFLLSEYAAPGYASSVESLFAPEVDGVVRGNRLTFGIRSEDGKERMIDCAFAPGVYQGAPALWGTGYELPERPADGGAKDDGAGSLLAASEDLLLCFMDAEGVPVFLTEGFRRISSMLWGRAPEEEESLLKLLPSDAEGASFRVAFERACAGEPAETGLETGESLFACAFAPVYSREGVLLGTSLLLTDRKERRRLEQERSAEAENFQRLFAVSSEMMLISSVEEGRIVRSTPSFLSRTGYSEGALSGMKEEDLCLHPDAEERKRLLVEIRRNGFVEDFEAEIENSSGERFSVCGVVAMITTGGRDCLLYVLRDVPSKEEESLPERRCEDVSAEALDILPEPSPEAASEAPTEAPAEPSYREEAVQPSPSTLEHCRPSSAASSADSPCMLFSEREDALICALDSECMPLFMTRGFKNICETLWGRFPKEKESILGVLPSGLEGESFRTAIRKALSGEASQTGQESGASYFLLSFSPAHDADGRLSGISLLVTDKTAQRSLERERRAEADRFRRLFSASPEMMLISSAEEGRLLQCNRAFLSRMGYSEPSVLGRTEEELGIYEGPGQRERLLKELEDVPSVEKFEVRLKASSGEVFPAKVSVERIETEGRHCLLSVFHDISNEKQAEDRKRAPMDTLSGIPNRQGFERILNTEIDRAMRYKGNMSLILIDVDGFGALNEALGRAAGDRVLKDFCTAVKGRIRPTDFIGRWGGDEFAVLTPMSGPLAFQVAEAIRDMIYHYKFLPDRTLSSSIGVAEFRRSMDMFEFIQRAEDALAEAKKAGGNKALLAPFVP